MFGRLHLNGQGNNFETLDGNGSIDVPNGKLYNLPLLLNLLKFLGLRRLTGPPAECMLCSASMACA